MSHESLSCSTMYIFVVEKKKEKRKISNLSLLLFSLLIFFSKGIMLCHHLKLIVENIQYIMTTNCFMIVQIKNNCCAHMALIITIVMMM